MIDFTKDQTMTGESFFAAMEAHQRAEMAYANARVFVPVAETQRLERLIKFCRFIVFPYAFTRSDDWPFNHNRMYKREFRDWLKQCQIHTFCYYWESNRMLVISNFSADGESFWDYRYDSIVRTEKPADKRDFTS